MPASGRLKVTSELLDNLATDGAAAVTALDEYDGRLEVDAGNLLVIDPAAQDTDDFPTPAALASADVSEVSNLRKQLNEAVKQIGQGVLQGLMRQLFALPVASVSKKDSQDGGKLVELPAPTTPLPREKPLPKDKPKTRWEQFAEQKGIRKRKRSKLVWDEDAGEWRRRYGYGRVKDLDDQIILPHKPGDDPNEDPWERREKERKGRVSKNETQRVANLKRAAKESGQKLHIDSHGKLNTQDLPSTLALSSVLPLEANTSMPITGSRKHTREQLRDSAKIAGVATASMGKFDKEVRGEGKDTKANVRKSKVVAAAAGGKGGGREKAQAEGIMGKIIAKNASDVLDMQRAMKMVNRAERAQKEAEAERKRNRPTKMPKKLKGKAAALAASGGVGKAKGKGKGKKR